jgi:O-antigen/teichoic acid export membrane protein
MNIKNLSIDFVFYGSLDFLQRAIGIIMLPVYTRILTQNEYGRLDIIIIVGSILCVLVDMQFIEGFSRFYYEYRKIEKGKRFTGTVIVSRFIGGVAISLIFLMTGFFLNADIKFLPSFNDNTIAWVFIAATIPLTLIYDVLLLQARMLRRKKSFTLGVISSCLFSAIFSVFFIVILRWGIAGVIFGLFLGKLISFFLVSMGLHREIQLCFDIEVLKKLIKYSLPLVPGWWLAFASAYLGRFFIFGKLGADENAVLAVCMKIASIIGLFSKSFRLAWQPLAMACIGDERGETFYVRSMRLFISIGMLTIFSLSIIVMLFLNVFVPLSYSVVRYYFPFFAVGSLLSACANNLQLGNQIAKTTHNITLSAAICVAVNIIILVVFTESYGIITVGFGWIFSFTVKNVVAYITAQKNYYIPYDKKSFILFGFGCILLIILGFAIHTQYIPNWLFISCAAFIGTTFSWFIIAPFERQQIMRFLKTSVINVFS